MLLSRRKILLAHEFSVVRPDVKDKKANVVILKMSNESAGNPLWSLP